MIMSAAEEHRRVGLAAVTGKHYEGGHWLGSFAVLSRHKAWHCPEVSRSIMYFSERPPEIHSASLLLSVA
jgi:hypothetical protein